MGAVGLAIAVCGNHPDGDVDKIGHQDRVWQLGGDADVDQVLIFLALVHGLAHGHGLVHADCELDSERLADGHGVADNGSVVKSDGHTLAIADGEHVAVSQRNGHAVGVAYAYQDGHGLCHALQRRQRLGGCVGLG